MTSSCVTGLGHDIVLDLAAHKERLMKEELRLNDANDKDKYIDITLHARVLGRHYTHMY